MKRDLWKIHRRSDGPIVSTAIHSGHHVRHKLSSIMAIDEATRLREEDPFTDRWTEFADVAILPTFSRFEVDLNRPGNMSVYQTPQEAWGLDLWREPPSIGKLKKSWAIHDAFYTELERILDELVNKYERVAVIDIHSYCHRRGGPDAPFDNPERNPEINVGTGTMNRYFWAPLVDRFIDDLRSYNYFGRHLDVRENVRFWGGNLPYWIHTNYPTTVCDIVIEVKKFFMDEWTGEPDEAQIGELLKMLESALPGLREGLDNAGKLKMVDYHAGFSA